jgi:hypothetical protein
VDRSGAIEPIEAATVFEAISGYDPSDASDDDDLWDSCLGLLMNGVYNRLLESGQSIDRDEFRQILKTASELSIENL